MTSEFARADSDDKTAVVAARSVSPSMIVFFGAFAFYFLAIGPILKLDSLGLMPTVVRQVLLTLYMPVIFLYEYYGFVRAVINWYASLFGEMPRL